MTNPFTNRSTSLSGPGIDYAPVVPADNRPLPDVAVALYVEAGGAVTFRSQKGQIRTVSAPDFGWILCGVSEVRATGTTASGIHAIVVS